jgi:putative membrane protein
MTDFFSFSILFKVLLILVAIIHLYIVILEMFLWTTTYCRKAFGIKSLEFAEETKVLAANQGLYNLFLVVGLIWGLISDNPYIGVFFLSCVFTAGLYGAYSTKKVRILYIQSIPAVIGLILFALI